MYHLFDSNEMEKIERKGGNLLGRSHTCNLMMMKTNIIIIT